MDQVLRFITKSSSATLLIFGLALPSILTGCASSSTKATEYCDANWKEQGYSNWNECYSCELPNQNKGLKAIGLMLRGAGQGLSKQQSQSVSCISCRNVITCTAI